MYRADIVVVLCLVAAVLPWTLVEGKGCWAGPSTPGRECLYGSVLPSGRDMVIRYRFTSILSFICCEVYQCRYPSNCGFERMPCSGGGSFQSDVMPWEVRGVEPIMRCFDARRRGVYYSYEVETFESDENENR